jgi:hypothetical protein
MDLVEAFSVVRGLCRDSGNDENRLSEGGNEGVTEVDTATRNEAARIILAELRRLAKRISFLDDMVGDEVVQQTLWKLMSGRASLVDDINESRVRAYLWRALSNNRNTTFRSAKREILADDKMLEIAGKDGERQQQRESFHLQDYEWAANEIENVLIPKICLRLRSDAAESMKWSWREMWAIAIGENSVEELLLSDGSTDFSKNDQDFKRRRNALYQRHSRTRRRILEWVLRLRRRGRLGEVEAQQIESVIELTRRR